MNISESAEKLRDLGLNVIPLKPQSKEPVSSWKKYQDEQYLESIPADANIGIVCGKTSENLVVIDIDSKEFTLIDKIFPDALQRTLVVETSKGYHIYIKVSKLPNTLRLDDHDNLHIDIQSQGTFVVGPSSIHPDTKKEYKIISAIIEIAHIDFKEIEINLEKLGFDIKQKQYHSIKEIERNGTTEGSRNNLMFKLACHLLNKHDEATALDHLEKANEKNNPPLDLREIHTLFDSAKNYASDPKEDCNENSSIELLEFAEEQIKKLVISQNNSKEVYAVIENNGRLETLNLSSQRAIHWLTYAHYNQNKSAKVHGQDFYKNVLSTIIAKSQMDGTKKERVYNRISFQNNVLYYDLCTFDWDMVKITKNDIQTVSFSEDMPIFRRTQSSFEQVKPVFEEIDSLEKMVNLLRIKDKQIFKVHLACMFLESIPVPIMFFDGEAGSMKTTTTASVKRIIDPNGDHNEDNCSAISTKNDDLIIQLYNRYVSAFDNVTRISQEMSDTLCRAITGSGNLKRELYTNSEETILNFRRKIILNGIIPSVDYPDLQDRIISYARKSLVDNDRLTDQEFQERFNNLLPLVLGQIFAVIQKALKQYDKTKHDIKPKTRLADFEIWGEIISRELGYSPNSFLQLFYEKQKQSSIESIDSQPLVAAIVGILEGRIEYESTVANCLNILRIKAQESGIDTKSPYVRFPKAPNQLSRQLRVIKPLLTKLGIDIETSHYTKGDGKYTKHSSIVRFRKLDMKSSPSSLSSLTRNCEANRKDSGEYNGEDTTKNNLKPSPQTMLVCV